MQCIKNKPITRCPPNGENGDSTDLLPSKINKKKDNSRILNKIEREHF